MKYSWSAQEVDEKLHDIMVGIFHDAYNASKEYGVEGNLLAGANIAGFVKVADAMMAQGDCVNLSGFHKAHFVSQKKTGFPLGTCGKTGLFFSPRFCKGKFCALGPWCSCTFSCNFWGVSGYR